MIKQPTWDQAKRIWARTHDGLYYTTTDLIKAEPQWIAKSSAGNKLIANPARKDEWMTPCAFKWYPDDDLWSYAGWPIAELKDRIIIYKDN